MKTKGGVIYGAKADAQIQRTVREVARRMMNSQPPRARWMNNTEESGGSKIISFSITSSDPTIRSALVEIRQRSFTGTVYGSTLADTVVTVYDTDGCFLNEPNVDLTGRNGKAVLMYVDAEAEAVHFPDYTVPTKYWNVISLCCPNTVCE